MIRLVLFVCALAVGPLEVLAMDRSARPVARPGGSIAVPAPAAAASPRLILRSLQRAAPSTVRSAGPDAGEEAAPPRGQTQLSVARPAERPNRLFGGNGLFGNLRRTPEPTLCGQPGIVGEVVGRVPGRIAGCGIDAAVRITGVAGVQLSTPSLMDCRTAQAVNRWMTTGAKKAFGRTGGGLAQVRVAAHYACRTRNNRPGARISEHGKGRAIDISAFTMQDGTTVTVLNGWNDPKYRQAMRFMHQDACGTFGTVLGPNSDRFHRDHFHFDTAVYRTGPYCR